MRTSAALGTMAFLAACSTSPGKTLSLAERSEAACAPAPTEKVRQTCLRNIYDRYFIPRDEVRHSIVGADPAPRLGSGWSWRYNLAPGYPREENIGPPPGFP